jgi:hypothetical protein
VASNGIISTNHELFQPLLNGLKAGVASNGILGCKSAFKNEHRALLDDGHGKGLGLKAESIVQSAFKNEHRTVMETEHILLVVIGAFSFATQFTVATGKKVDTREEYHW